MATKVTYEKNFEELKKLIEKTDVTGFDPFAFQFTIVGEGEGCFYFAVKDGKADIQPYDYADNTAVFKASADTFKQLAEGKLAPADAIASGALIVEGGPAGCADIFNAIAANCKKATKKAASAKEEKKAAPAKEEVKEEAPAKKEEAPKKTASAAKAKGSKKK